jgi:hypothetical protein
MREDPGCQTASAAGVTKDTTPPEPWYKVEHMFALILRLLGWSIRRDGGDEDAVRSGFEAAAGEDL